MLPLQIPKYFKSKKCLLCENPIPLLIIGVKHIDVKIAVSP